jgi:hypothetical protein
MRVQFTPSPELYPFQSRWFETDGIRVHYVDEGDAAQEISDAVTAKLGSANSHSATRSLNGGLG